jgi:hypothetical protein
MTRDVEAEAALPPNPRRQGGDSGGWRLWRKTAALLPVAEKRRRARRCQGEMAWRRQANEEAVLRRRNDGKTARSREATPTRIWPLPPPAPRSAPPTRHLFCLPRLYPHSPPLAALPCYSFVWRADAGWGGGDASDVGPTIWPLSLALHIWPGGAAIWLARWLGQPVGNSVRARFFSCLAKIWLGEAFWEVVGDPLSHLSCPSARLLSAA